MSTRIRRCEFFILIIAIAICSSVSRKSNDPGPVANTPDPPLEVYSWTPKNSDAAWLGGLDLRIALRHSRSVITPRGELSLFLSDCLALDWPYNSKCRSFWARERLVERMLPLSGGGSRLDRRVAEMENLTFYVFRGDGCVVVR